MSSIGYGFKHDFTKGPNYPPPNKYIIKTVFQKNKQKNKGKIFGVSRKVSCISFIPIHKAMEIGGCFK
jgi:hypothetical protein